MRHVLKGEVPVDLKLYSSHQGCDELIRGDNRNIHSNYSSALQPSLKSRH